MQFISGDRKADEADKVVKFPSHAFLQDVHVGEAKVLCRRIADE